MVSERNNFKNQNKTHNNMMKSGFGRIATILAMMSGAMGATHSAKENIYDEGEIADFIKKKKAAPNRFSPRKFSGQNKSKMYRTNNQRKRRKLLSQVPQLRRSKAYKK